MTSDGIDTTVLLVDYERQTRVQAKHTLEQAGLSVTEAKGFAQALELMSTEAPDLVVINLLRGSLAGISICRHIREYQGGWGKPILVMAWLDDADTIRQAFEAGATDIVTMPCHYLVLYYRVRCLLLAHRALQAVRKNKRDDVEMPRNSYKAPLDEIVHNSPLTDALSVERRAEILEENIFDVVTSPIDATMAVVNCIAPHSPQVTTRAQYYIESAKRDEQMAKLPCYDRVTGLPNKVMFKKLMASAIASSGHKEKVATLFLDIACNNEKCSENREDLEEKLQRAVAKGLKRFVYGIYSRGPNSQFYTIGRVGDRHFVVVLTDISSREGAASVAARIVRELSRPVPLEGREVSITTNIGISICPDDGSDVTGLMKKAEIAMYRGWKPGKSAYHFYEPSTTTSSVNYNSLMIT